jgi:hypothetical protein
MTQELLEGYLNDIDEDELKRLEKLLQIRETRMQFALDFHRNTRGEPMNFKRFPHIREIYETTARTLVLQGSVQSLKSEFCIIDHFAIAFTGLSIFYVLPKYETRNTYVQNRINRCVENVPEYKKIIGSSFFDSVALKQFGKGTVKYVGSNVLADFTEYPADVLIIDEVDECNADNLTYAVDRLRASPYQFRRYLGNPRISKKGINALFVDSDQREWYIPCTKCGKFAEADWFKVVVQELTDKEGRVVDYTLRDTEWFKGCGRDVHMICPQCSGPLKRDSQEGKWIPKNPESEIVGYHISMLCNMLNKIADMWGRFKKAVHDPAKMQQFYNSELGLPYNSAGNRVTLDLLRACSDRGEEEFNFQISGNTAHVIGDESIGPCTMGIDVGSSLDVRISERRRGRRVAAFIGKVKTIDDVCELMERYNVKVAVIDAMPEISLVAELQSVAPCEVWSCLYRQTEGRDRKIRLDYVEQAITADRTFVLDKGFADLKKGVNILPKNVEAVLQGTYVSEMTEPVRRLEKDSKGRDRFEWTSGEDHSRHADAYDSLAAYLYDEEVGGGIQVN